ncbi:hypothetical protein M2271_001496 [Streptomyces sp. LBL]|uniref:hypothetical protein n=1 Tax=Streptomyces sp. LBL TaxID=2940562 RepID=UPI002474F6CD|nr:hypothetical protein [Streptomyces sp. LBL]MDH6623704.1 hypothetical protein [Streptomyces sp. LBL]
MADPQGDPQGDQQGRPQDGPPELLDLYRFSTTCLALGIPEDRVAGDFLFGLEGLRQRGILRVEDLARVRAEAVGEGEAPAQWAAGFAAGYLSAWAAAVLRVLDTRDVGFSKELHRGVNLCHDADLLTRFLDRALTATHQADLVTGETSPRSAGRS